jgi:ABC-type transport system involved in cytochrome c biogenesis permease subunit
MADYQAYLAARDLLNRAAPFLMWPAVACAWLAALLSPLKKTRRPWAAYGVAGALFFLTLSFLLLVWYHWKIYQVLPLDLAGQAGDWINAQLKAMASRGQASFPPVDWARPPRFLIPFWIEGEKFFFWTWVLTLVVLIEERREHRGYRSLLRLMLALHVTGMAIYSDPLAGALPKFHGEMVQWFSAKGFDQVRYFFQIFPRMKYYYNAAYMWLHPPMLFIAYATLAATFAASIFTLGRAEPALDRSAYTYAKLGYLLLTFGMLVGYPWAIIAWGPNWWWDPKIASSIMMWLLYSAYLHQRFLSHHRHGRWQVSVLGIICYISLLFTYFMSWYFPGEHTF